MDTLTTSAAVYQRETYEQVIEDIKPLLWDHWAEVALYQDEVKLEPAWELYQGLEKNGRLVIVTCRRDGRLIGYAVFFLHHHIHYKSCLVASNDVLFLVKPERQGRRGLGLVLAAERILLELEVKRITWHVKPSHDFSPLLRRLGYALEETVMGKLIGD